MRNHPLLVAWLIAPGFLAALPILAAEPSIRHRSVLDAVKALDKPVTYTETKIPLGELVQKVAADTGASLEAAPEVADEPVAVVVKELPARELLDRLADLLDYQWARGPGPRTPNTQHRTPALQIYQDLGGKQREVALREAEVQDAERRLHEEVGRYAEVATLSPDQLQALLEEEKRRQQEFAKLSPEEQQSRSISPEERDRVHRDGAVRMLLQPIPRALARLIGGLSPRQWGLLHSQHQLTFSTDLPSGGNLPQGWATLLPKEIAAVFRDSPPSLLPPGAVSGFSDPGDEERFRQQEKRAQEQWAAATDYRVTLRLDTDHPLSAGVTLTATGAAVHSGGPQPSLSLPDGATLGLGSGPMRFLEQAEPQPPERRARLEKDPVFGVKQRFKPERKSGPAQAGPASDPWWRLRELLPELARAYDVQILADAYASSASDLLEPADFPSEPTPLFALLDRLAGHHDHWDGRGRVIRVRSRTWFYDRPREIPQHLVRRWRALFDQHGALPLEEYLRMMSELSDAQLDALPDIRRELALPPDMPGLADLYGGRHALRLYASLSPGQRQALEQGPTLTVAQMTPAQGALFMAAVWGVDQAPASFPGLARSAALGFALRLRPFVLTIDWRGGSTHVTMEPAPDASRSEPSAPHPPSSSPARVSEDAPAAAATSPSAAATAPGPEPGTIGPPDHVVHQRVIQVDFQIRSGATEGGAAGIAATVIVASQP